jgi:acyl-coenzyme A synthetase/AMP-(fatty) acid ligase
MNAESIIHKDFQIFSFDEMKFKDKMQILKNIQYWKNILIQKKSKRLVLADHLNFDSVSIFFAALELGIHITAVKIDRIVDTCTQHNIDTVMTSDYWFGRYQEIQNISTFNDIHLLIYPYSTVDPVEEYKPNDIDTDATTISGFTGGSTGEPKLIIHSVQEVLSASTIACNIFYRAKEKFLTHTNINHLGMITMAVVGPIMAGVHLMPSIHISDLVFYSSRGLVDKAILMETSAEFVKNYFSEMRFENIEILTGGKNPSPSFVEWALTAGVRRIYSIYGASECLPPVCFKIIDFYEYETLSSMGQLVEGYQEKIVDGRLYLKGPGVSRMVTKDKDGFYDTKDRVILINDGLQFCGREQINFSLFKTETECANLVNSLIAEQLNNKSKKFIFSTEYKLTITNDNLTIVFNDRSNLEYINTEQLAEKIMKYLGLKLTLECRKLKPGEIKEL